jgi:hypothetical protein
MAGKLIVFFFCLQQLIAYNAGATGSKIAVDKGKWTFTVHKITDTSYELIFHLQLRNGYRLWTNSMEANVNTIAPSFTYNNNSNIKFYGCVNHFGTLTKVKCTKCNTGNYYSGSVDFTQKVIVYGPTKVDGELGYQIGRESQCGEPATLAFAFDVGN